MATSVPPPRISYEHNPDPAFGDGATDISRLSCIVDEREQDVDTIAH
jgi:hypothetical protein